MPHHRRPVRIVAGRLLAALACVVWLIGATGCARRQQILKTDPRFSVNVTRTTSAFPGPQEPRAWYAVWRPAPLVLSDAEQETFDRLGRPDFVRLWWRTDGTFISSSDLADRIRQVPDLVARTPRSWVYLDRDEEVVFAGDGLHSRTQAISPQLRIICELGDPTHKSQPVMRSGQSCQQWVWVDHGLIVEFLDGVPAQRRPFTGTGTGTILTK